MIPQHFLAGLLHTLGAEPQPASQMGIPTGDYRGAGGTSASRLSAASQFRRWTLPGGAQADFGPGRMFGNAMEAPAIGSFREGVGRYAFPTFTLGMSAYNVYAGYREGGLGGAYDAAVYDVALNAGVMAAAGAAPGGTLRKFKYGGVHRYLGAGVGAAIGQSLGQATGIPMAGTLGAMAGGMVGAAPLATLAKHPLMTLGAVGLGATAGVAAGAVYGGAHLLKMGRQHAQSRRGINTSGSLAAFNTQGAFTMRQRAVQAMQKSHLNARSALGSESSLLAQSAYRNYHSRYR